MLIKINPMSANKMFQGRRFKTSEYKAWREEFGYKLKTDLRDLEPKFVKLEFGLKNFKMSDTDNFAKSTLDALTESGVIKDDRFIEKLHLEKKKVKNKEDEYIKITFL
jgi:Holliday junction resolvase RusA-like endonuclease